MCTLCDSTGLFEMIVGVLTTCHTHYTSDSSKCVFLFNRTTLPVFVTYLTGALYVQPLWFYRLFEMIVGVLTTCHTQYTWYSSICVFLFNRTTLPVFVTYLTGALYVHPLWFYTIIEFVSACQRWWFLWRFWFVLSVPGYLREEEEHKPDPWRNPIERNHMGLHLGNDVASC